MKIEWQNINSLSFRRPKKMKIIRNVLRFFEWFVDAAPDEMHPRVFPFLLSYFPERPYVPNSISRLIQKKTKWKGKWMFRRLRVQTYVEKRGLLQQSKSSRGVEVQCGLAAKEFSDRHQVRLSVSTIRWSNTPWSGVTSSVGMLKTIGRKSQLSSLTFSLHPTHLR